MFRIEPLGRHHDQESFDCGNSDLNNYLKRTARQHANKGLARTFVLLDDSAPQDILGFFTLAVCEIRSDQLPPQLAKKYPPIVPAAKLARLAVTRNRQREGLGRHMMVHALRLALQVSDNVGIIGFFVDAKDDEVGHYYRQYGFIPLPDDPLQLFLPLTTLRQVFKSPETGSAE